MLDNQLKVISWIKSGMKYTEGVDLLVELTRKQIFYNLFAGKDKSLSDKLAYEICKAAMLADHVTWKDFIQKVKMENETGISAKTVREENKSIVFNPEFARTENDSSQAESDFLELKPLIQYPTIIRRIIHEYAALFQERSNLHTVLTEMPESNAESVCAKRAEIFDLIKSISARLEILYEAKKAFDDKRDHT